jgi:DNA-binding GntR family transcriptional regulator
MPRLDSNAIRTMRVLDQHPRLDEFQIAALGELSVTEVRAALHQLAQNGLLQETAEDGHAVYSVDAEGRAEWLDARTSGQEAQPA